MWIAPYLVYRVSPVPEANIGATWMHVVKGGVRPRVFYSQHVLMRLFDPAVNCHY